jgi:hypothetical protein
MGQQQLLLLVLTVVLIGLAVVVGIEAFETNERKARLDEITNEAVRLAAEVQVWSLKSPVYNGPAEGEGFAGVSFSRLGYNVGDVYTTPKGQYAFTDAQAGCARLIGVDDAYDLEGGDPDDLDLYVQVVITGPGSEDIATSVDGTPITC